MKAADGFLQTYNAQTAEEADFQLIVGQAVTQAVNDKQQLGPMLQAVEAHSGQKPAQILADSAYSSEPNLAQLEEDHIEGFIAPGGRAHGAKPPCCARGQVRKATPRVERMRRKFQSKTRTAIYAAQGNR